MDKHSPIDHSFSGGDRLRDSHNLTSLFRNFELGNPISVLQQEAMRRVTAIKCHPTNPEIIAIATKWDDLFIWNHVRDHLEPSVALPGPGPGGSIQAMIFDEHSHCKKMYSVSINGTLTHRDFIGLENPSCVVTTSLDQNVNVWDIRNMKDKDTCLSVQHHDRPINSAHFSRTDGSLLLTTDQHSQLRVYSANSFHLIQYIMHPHRQFQHLTPIKASWHPLADIIVVGASPDPSFPGFTENEPRTVDFFNASTGRLLHQSQDQTSRGKIVSRQYIV